LAKVTVINDLRPKSQSSDFGSWALSSPHQTSTETSFGVEGRLKEWGIHRRDFDHSTAVNSNTHVWEQADR
jgi:hypothetical protein